MENRIKPSSPSGNPDKCSANVLTQRGAAGSVLFSHSCSSFVFFFFPCSLSLPVPLSPCLCPLPKALKTEENHSTSRGEMLIHRPRSAGKAGREQGPWHTPDEFSDRSVILNGAPRALRMWNLQYGPRSPCWNWFFLLVNEGQGRMKAQAEMLSRTREADPSGETLLGEGLGPPWPSLGAAGIMGG